MERKISQLERFKIRMAKAVPDKGTEALIMDLLLQASAFYGRGLTMEEIITFTEKSRNTVKTKFLSMPVRCIKVSNNRKKFSKIDWTALR